VGAINCISPVNKSVNSVHNPNACHDDEGLEDEDDDDLVELVVVVIVVVWESLAASDGMRKVGREMALGGAFSGTAPAWVPMLLAASDDSAATAAASATFQGGTANSGLSCFRVLVLVVASNDDDDTRKAWQLNLCNCSSSVIVGARTRTKAIRPMVVQFA
jgi:hypothetical protein